jgi:hypothetical protein
MSQTIEQEMLELSDEDIVRFSERLTDVLNSDSWIAQRELQDSDARTAAMVLCCEMFQGKFSYCK